jgi:hypothetical protein
MLSAASSQTPLPTSIPNFSWKTKFHEAKLRNKQVHLIWTRGVPPRSSKPRCRHPHLVSPGTTSSKTRGELLCSRHSESRKLQGCPSEQITAVPGKQLVTHTWVWRVNESSFCASYSSLWSHKQQRRRNVSTICFVSELWVEVRVSDLATG